MPKSKHDGVPPAKSNPAPKSGRVPKLTAYEVAITKIFLSKYQDGDKEVRFSKRDIDNLATDADVCAANGGEPLSNPPALIYEFRSRRAIPKAIVDRACPDAGCSWTIELDGKSNYVFRQIRGLYIEPKSGIPAIEIPDATPEIVAMYALDDEQALLAKIRYNRLIDIFLGIVSYSLQNHLRTSTSMGSSRSQIEIDEIYVGVDKTGRHFVIPIQAKGGSDKLSKMQAKQDVAWCRERLPDVECRPISAQFVGDEIVLFLLVEKAGELSVEEEQRYKLVPRDGRTRPTASERRKKRRITVEAEF